MVGRRKLPDTSLNRIFNVLSIGVQYTLSFQGTNFGLKCLFLKTPQKTLLKHLIIKPFDLINTIPLTRTKTLVNNLIMSKF